jgi:molybdopterin-guanine dinucleotide biosynthesis protein A
MPLIAPSQITGLVLAGGRGSRMGGVDKGLQLHLGQPLAWHAMQRLAPQVGSLMVNANRHPELYASLGAPVWPDTLPDYPGPLAGFLTGLTHCRTDFLMSVPCDTPNFPVDLVARLAEALVQAEADLAIAISRDSDGRLRSQPAFCLMRADLQRGLMQFLQTGQRKVECWTDQHRCASVLFDEPEAFVNVNTLAELQALQAPPDGS